MNQHLTPAAESVRPPPYKAVSVKVSKVEPGSGNAGKLLQYQVDCPAITIHRTDTVINYYLDAPTPANIVFKKFTPPHTQEFSRGSLSVDKKTLTFSDLNSKHQSLEIKLWFDVYAPDGNGRIEDTFFLDPQVGNEPVVEPAPAG